MDRRPIEENKRTTKEQTLIPLLKHPVRTFETHQVPVSQPISPLFFFLFFLRTGVHPAQSTVHNRRKKKEMPSRSRQLHAFLLLYFGRLSHTKACDGVTSERREYSVHRYDKYTTGRSCANNSKYCRYNRFETKGKIDHKKTEKIRVHYWICICSAFSAIFCFYISIGGDDFTIFRPPQNRS